MHLRHDAIHLPRDWVISRLHCSRQNRALEGLEVRYLANRDYNLCFGLLTDLVDAKQEVFGVSFTLAKEPNIAIYLA